MDIVNKGIQFSWQLTWGNILQEIIDSDQFFWHFYTTTIELQFEKCWFMETFNSLIKWNCCMQWSFQRKWIKILISKDRGVCATLV